MFKRKPNITFRKKSSLDFDKIISESTERIKNQYGGRDFFCAAGCASTKDLEKCKKDPRSMTSEEYSLELVQNIYNNYVSSATFIANRMTISTAGLASGGANSKIEAYNKYIIKDHKNFIKELNLKFKSMSMELKYDKGKLLTTSTTTSMTIP